MDTMQVAQRTALREHRAPERGWGADAHRAPDPGWAFGQGVLLAVALSVALVGLVAGSLLVLGAAGTG